MNLAHTAALNRAKPKIAIEMGLSSREVAAKNVKAQNQTLK
jgi:hypothetical protein